MTITADSVVPRRTSERWRRSSDTKPAMQPNNSARSAEGTVVTALGIVSVLNYGYTLVLVWLLPAREYAVVLSASALLLICGTVSTASIPWVLAREVARAGDDSARRSAALSFCAIVTAMEAVVAGIATSFIALTYADNIAVAAVFGSVVTIFTAATAVGYLQGLQRFRLIASLRIAEVLIKVGTGVALVELGAGASGAVAGFGFGAGFVAAGAMIVMWPDLRQVRRSAVDLRLLRDAGGLMSIQGGVALLASLDVVVASLAVANKSSLATYQVAQILTRVPVFIATALSMAMYPRLSAGIGRASTSIRATSALFVRITIPVSITIATLPTTITSKLFPHSYGNVGRLLAWGAAGGALMGVINLVTTYFQADATYARPAVVLAIGVVIQVGLVLLGLHLGGIVGMAAAVAVGGTLVTGTLVAATARRWPGSMRGLLRQAITVAVLAGPLVALRGSPVRWACWMIVGGAIPAIISLARFRHQPGSHRPGGRPRALHLGYEDPRRPGAGGGSARTHAINRRLADEWDITVACARYRGARPRHEDGVHYVHVGLPIGYFPSIVAYFICIPYALWRYPSDLVIEDFGAPWSTVGVPLLTGNPVVGLVQWLFAREKAQQYHLPFHLLESAGVRTHKRMVAVSDDMALALRERNPAADVTVVANGVDDEAFSTLPRVPRQHIAYLGRLEIAQKGLDLLLESYASVAADMEADLLIGGDGPDAAALVTLSLRLHISDRVHFLGRVAAEDRFEFLAGAQLLAMPSRFESFGMVAAEAMAVGTPVLAFDIPSLRSIVTPETGVLVGRIEATAYAEALSALMADAGLLARLGREGPQRMRSYSWDHLAKAQAAVYRAALADCPERVGR